MAGWVIQRVSTCQEFLDGFCRGELGHYHAGKCWKTLPSTLMLLNNYRGAESVVQVSRNVCPVFSDVVQLVSPKISQFPLTFKAALEIQKVEEVLIVPLNRKSLLSRPWQVQAQLQQSFSYKRLWRFGTFPFSGYISQQLDARGRICTRGQPEALVCSERSRCTGSREEPGSHQQGNCSVHRSLSSDNTPGSLWFQGKKCHCLGGLLPWAPGEGIGTDQSVEIVQTL